MLVRPLPANATSFGGIREPQTRGAGFERIAIAFSEPSVSV